ncbi:MAG: type III pantothenate kinase [Fimbriimonas sp.]
MLLAIDVGNTHTVFGIWDRDNWRAIWRRATDPSETSDQIGAWLEVVLKREGLTNVRGAVCASVVPRLDTAISEVCREWVRTPLQFLRSGVAVGLDVVYEPPTSVGADRLANALAAREGWGSPVIVVDFGTATKFDVVDIAGRFVGGAILPGVKLSAEALFAKAAKLPTVEIVAPVRALGQSTQDALRSGIVLGYADAVEGLLGRLQREVGEATAIATGGLGEPFLELCPSLSAYIPTLTLDGLVIAAGLLRPEIV